MAGRPYFSKLAPYRAEIAALRKPSPPVSYVEIARILKERHGLQISPNAIWSFVKHLALGHTRTFYQLPENKECNVHLK
jgi:hypothetical protein